MAELPELETVRRELEKEAVGKRFKAPEVTGAKVVRAQRPRRASRPASRAPRSSRSTARAATSSATSTPASCS